VSDDEEDKRGKEINLDRGMAVSRLKGGSDWHVMSQIKQNLLQDLHNKLFMQATEGKPLLGENNYGLIMANRQGVIDGVNQFFSLLDSYESIYLTNKGGQE
jgi:hypothetical protein